MPDFPEGFSPPDWATAYVNAQPQGTTTSSSSAGPTLNLGPGIDIGNIDYSGLGQTLADVQKNIDQSSTYDIYNPSGYKSGLDIGPVTFDPSVYAGPGGVSFTRDVSATGGVGGGGLQGTQFGEGYGQAEKVQADPQYQVQKNLSTLLKNNQFGEAVQYAQQNDAMNYLTDPNVLRNLREPFSKDEAAAFLQAMPSKVGSWDYDPSKSISSSLSKWDSSKGYPDATTGLYQKEDLGDKLIKGAAVGALALGAGVGAGQLIGAAGLGGAGAGTAAGAGASTGLGVAGAAAAKSAALNALFTAVQGGDIGQILKAGVLGAATGGLSAYAAPELTGIFTNVGINPTIAKSLTNAIVSGGITGLKGGNPLEGALTSFASSMIGAAAKEAAIKLTEDLKDANLAKTIASMGGSAALAKALGNDPWGAMANEFINQRVNDVIAGIKNQFVDLFPGTSDELNKFLEGLKKDFGNSWDHIKDAVTSKFGGAGSTTTTGGGTGGGSTGVDGDGGVTITGSTGTGGTTLGPLGQVGGSGGAKTSGDGTGLPPTGTDTGGGALPPKDGGEEKPPPPEDNNPPPDDGSGGGTTPPDDGGGVVITGTNGSGTTLGPFGGLGGVGGAKTSGSSGSSGTGGGLKEITVEAKKNGDTDGNPPIDLYGGLNGSGGANTSGSSGSSETGGGLKEITVEAKKDGDNTDNPPIDLYGTGSGGSGTSTGSGPAPLSKCKVVVTGSKCKPDYCYNYPFNPTNPPCMKTNPPNIDTGGIKLCGGKSGAVAQQGAAPVSGLDVPWLDTSAQMLGYRPSGGQIKGAKLGELHQILANMDPSLRSAIADRGIGAMAQQEFASGGSADQSGGFSAFSGTSCCFHVVCKLMPQFAPCTTDYLASSSYKKHDPLTLAKLVQIKNQMGSMGGAYGMAKGGLPHEYHAAAPEGHDPEFITGLTGYYAQGGGTGQSDDIPAMLHDGDYVMDADTVAALGDGSSKAGAEVLEKFRKQVPYRDGHPGKPVPAKIADGEYVFPAAFVTALGGGDNKQGSKILDGMRERLRAHKRSAPTSKIPPKAKSPLDYLKGAKG